MRLIDADELMEHVWRDKLDSRELIAEMVKNAPTIAPVFEKTGQRAEILCDGKVVIPFEAMCDLGLGVLAFKEVDE